MQFSLNWIRQYVALPADVDADAIASRLTGAGMAVEGADPFDDGSADGDVVFDIDVTTNRPDCMNHVGLARELAVLFAVPFTPEEKAITVGEPASTSASDAVSVAIDDAGCRRFAATVVRGVAIGSSPSWLVRRLEAIGVRAINNVVDVTNYLLWAYGQPIHAYDRDKLAGAELNAREARAGESVVTLDGQTRKLEAGMLVIADREQPVGLAGVMGGLDSEVTEATTDVVIEAAHFLPIPVRKTARAVGLHTDACHRFERGADIGFCAEAAMLAARMIQHLAGGEILRGAVDVAHSESATVVPPIRLDHQRLERFGGLAIEPAEVERILGGLGFALESVKAESDETEDDRGWNVVPPSWRAYDFEKAFPADVYEEVLRIIGFDATPSTLPTAGRPDAPESAEHRRRRMIQDHLAAAGFAEHISWAFHDAERAETYPSLFGSAAALPVANPLSERYAVMRRSLLPDLVEAGHYNLRRGASAVRLFEVGRVFAPAQVEHPFALPEAPVTEVETIALVAGGRLGLPWQRQVELDFFDLKGVVESVAASRGVDLVARVATVPHLVAGAAAELVRADDPTVVVGVIGQIADYDSTVPLFVAEVATAGLAAGRADLEVTAPPKLPGIQVDATLTHARTHPWDQIATAIDKAAIEGLVGHGLKDRYDGEGVPEGAVNTTIRFRYHGGDRVLTQEEVNARQEALVANLTRDFGFSA